MLNFNYQNPTRILFGAGQLENLPDLIPAEARVLLMAGRGSIRENGVYDQIKAALAERSLSEFWGVEPNPELSTLGRAIEQARSEKIDFLLAVGGGSVIDAAKFVAAAAPSSTEPLALLRGMRITQALPIGAVSTLPGTGSEANANGAISNRETGQKLVFSNPLLFPRFAVLDPETTYSLPPAQVGNGVVDAFVHVAEQYLTFPAGGTLQDRLAEAILLTLVEQGPIALSEPKNYDARANLMWAAALALNGLIGQGVPQDWTTHHIGHELTALFGIEHARTLAIVLPAVLRARSAKKSEKLLQYGARIFGVTSGTEAERISETIERTRAFFESMGLPTRLSAYERSAADVPQVVANLKANRRLRMGERLDITPDEAGKILLLAE